MMIFFPWKSRESHLFSDTEMRSRFLYKLLVPANMKPMVRNLHRRSISNWRAALKDELRSRAPTEKKNGCIYRVPINMSTVEIKAYHPNIISIGPYHHGRTELQEMEKLKWGSFRRLLDRKIELDALMTAVEDMEEEARECYSSEIEFSKENFQKIMLIDGCFIVEIFRELERNDFSHARSIKRWMLPSLRRDLIMLENQLPLFVQQKLFELTSRSEQEEFSLQHLALRFFNSLLRRDSIPLIPNQRIEASHFLDLFRSSILPRRSPLQTDQTEQEQEEEDEQKMSHTMRSVIELKEAGIMIETDPNSPTFDVRCEGRVLKIPPLHIDDYRATLFRNLAAFEQCHFEYRDKPDVTSYLFFIDGLINSAEDVELLHHKEVLHHSLGSDKEVARLVNSLCKEIAKPDPRENYLKKAVYEANSYFYSPYAKIRARLVYHYFSSWVVAISTAAAAAALYLTLIQTASGFLGQMGEGEESEQSLGHYLVYSFFLVFYGRYEKWVSLFGAIPADWFNVC